MPSDDDRASASEKTPVDSMLHHIQKELFPDGAISTAWILSTEWIGIDGDYYTVTLTDDKAPPWHHIGILAKSQAELDESLVDENEEE